MEASSVTPAENTSAQQPLTRDEARRYGELGSKMEYFHNYFKKEYVDIYELADGSFNKRGMSLDMFLQAALQFREHLHAHHTIEERRIFPLLAKKMPTFADNEQHRKSHEGIHEGLDSLMSLISRYRADPKTYSPTEMRACLDSFRDVLMRHLDEEVNDLRAENMRKYWTLDEIESFPW